MQTNENSKRKTQDHLGVLRDSLRVRGSGGYHRTLSLRLKTRSVTLNIRLQRDKRPGQLFRGADRDLNHRTWGEYGANRSARRQVCTIDPFHPGFVHFVLEAGIGHIDGGAKDT